jgi:hypothetical protein
MPAIVPVPLHNIGTDRLPPALAAGIRIIRQKLNTPDAYRSTTIIYLQEKIRSGSGNRTGFAVFLLNYKKQGKNTGVGTVQNPQCCGSISISMRIQI